VTTASATIRNNAGIHVRPSGVIHAALREYPGTVKIARSGQPVEIQGVLSLIALGLQKGDHVSVTVDGPDEERVCRTVVKLLAKRYDFPPRAADS
jgi:phosphocarrier protein